MNPIKMRTNHLKDNESSHNNLSKKLKNRSKNNKIGIKS